MSRSWQQPSILFWIERCFRSKSLIAVVAHAVELAAGTRRIAHRRGL